MAKCLVTGGAGFIGSHLVEALLKEGHEVRVLDDFSTGKLANLQTVSSSIDLVKGSILNLPLLENCVQGVRWIFHLAALPSIQRSVDDPMQTHAVCVTGTLNVLEAARKHSVQRLIFAASSSVYGGNPGIVRKEDDPLVPLSPYAAAKLACEHYCTCYTKVFGLETVRLRFFNIFGPRQDHHSPYSGVVALFHAALANGQAPKIYGDGLQSRDFTYVDNAVQALLKAAVSRDASGKVYNIGTGNSTTIMELVLQLSKGLAAHPLPIFVPARAGEARHSRADISLAQRELGYVAISFHEGLQRLITNRCDDDRVVNKVAANLARLP